MKGFVEVSFYCLNCGKKNPMPVQKMKGRLNKSGHRKRLYCINCREEVNNIYLATEKDVEKFKEDFAAGVYQDEAAESIAYIKGGCLI